MNTNIIRRLFSLLLLITVFNGAFAQLKTDVIIIGGGASGTMAAIQSARLGVNCIVLEETTWLGGMLTSAGVSAIDGNHKLPSGLWAEFREELYKYYGGPSAVATGWVSNTLFEPSVGQSILRKMIDAERNVEVLYNTAWSKAVKINDGWLINAKNSKGKNIDIKGKILIDATELGDVMASLNIPYYLGMDSKSITNETFALEQSNDIIQDLTYVITLKDYGKGKDKSIKKPKNYDPKEFAGCCDVSDPATLLKDNNDCFKMLTYGRLPNNKFMINWPKKGNDIYLNIIEKNRDERVALLEEAKQMTLRFIYYIQHDLGYKHLGIDFEEYPTKDGFPMLPYHRESRRLKAKSLFSLQHIMTPYETKESYYRTGVVVGDYTVDHHHYKYGNAPEIDFVKIRVPSYNIPLGSLIPENYEGLIVAEKSIGVSNIVNGATRLQPVVLGIGQASGVLAALSIKNSKNPSQISIREVQQVLLDNKAFIMPFIDVTPEDPHFKILQKIGATGVLKGVGIPFRWANQTWFYPEREISEYELMEGLRGYYPSLNSVWDASGNSLTVGGLKYLLSFIKVDLVTDDILKTLKDFEFDTSEGENTKLNRRMTSILLDKHLKLFEKQIDYKGTII